MLLLVSVMVFVSELVVSTLSRPVLYKGGSYKYGVGRRRRHENRVDVVENSIGGVFIQGDDAAVEVEH